MSWQADLTAKTRGRYKTIPVLPETPENVDESSVCFPVCFVFFGILIQLWVLPSEKCKQNVDIFLKAPYKTSETAARNNKK